MVAAVTRVPGTPRGRSPEARKRRGDKYLRLTAGGRRIACDVCNLLHKPPACPPGAESVNFCVVLPPHVARDLNARVVWGERSSWVVRLIRRELDV